MSEQEIANLLADIHAAAGDGDYIFRGENNEKHKKISSKLYRVYEDTFEQRSDLIVDAMQDLVLQDVNRYIDFKEKSGVISLLTPTTNSPKILTRGTNLA